MTLYRELIPSSGQFENTINSIISRPDYINLRNSLSDFIDNIKQMLVNLLIRVIKMLVKGAVNAPRIADSLSNIFIIAAILVITAVLIVIVVKISKTFERKRRVTEILGEKIDEKTTPLTLKRRAEEYLKQKDYRAAVRFDFIALLLLMHERNVVYLDEAKTNEEIYEYLKTTGFYSVVKFKELIDIFNSCWYGHIPFDETNYSTWELELTLVWNEVMQDANKKK